MVVSSAVKRVLACAACNQPGKRYEMAVFSHHIWTLFIALSKSIQITVINDPIYAFREVRFI
jgi:hypothetical protein